MVVRIAASREETVLEGTRDVGHPVAARLRNLALAAVNVKQLPVATVHVYF